ncbi:MAG: 2-oxoacid:acceptor oxidoreductase subunit alpha [Acidimicrobiia bacterium]|nr:2-oxoacid:acceptor oxidoreductase subunit alpha [Acidimicrobiia bacterium]MBT8215637.1 2-oxoacid:acceptor oxidoreductase subunit alpha [Acidimicrobiia bacterium]NNF09911.1 2-oxoacid:acceptor oxidoreductase subunit alpha [Acidimicrobiia bacterium]NNL70538.1 2-oxoacid:acceptor oxidoreductase subunit alpha [Acidimicrobiia bacterium]
MQLAGARFTDASAAFGNDLATLPNFPAEIRAPAGTLPGVSAFQIHIAGTDILTPGDSPDVLVAMNPAALKKNLDDLKPGGVIVVNTDSFEERNLAKAGYETNPLEDGTLDGYNVLPAPMDELTKEAVKDSGVTGRAVLRSKNFFALGALAWMFDRPADTTIEWVEQKFGSKPEVVAANTAAFKAGYNYGITTEAFAHTTFEVPAADLPAGTYTNVVGNQTLAWGLIAGARAAGLPLFYASYPITPASDVLHELARHKNFGVKTFQAEDEIAAVGVALGASFAGHLGVTGTSGPGVALKSETISLALMAELPMVIVDVQRGGPSTGLPTKTEQSDLMMALHGRHGEAPMPVISASSPGDAFDTAIEACRIAVKYMTPVLLMSDGYIGTSSEPWKLPDIEDLPSFPTTFATEVNHDDGFMPYLRDPESLGRPWAVPGTPGLEHRVGGLEKDQLTGNVSYDPKNHETMTLLREEKTKAVAKDIPDIVVEQDADADLIVVGWGSTYSAVLAGIKNSRAKGNKVAHIHLRYLNPFPGNLGEVLARYPKVLVPELNRGQLSRLLRAEFLTPTVTYSKVQGQPFKAAEIEAKISELLEAE